MAAAALLILGPAPVDAVAQDFTLTICNRNSLLVQGLFLRSTEDTEGKNSHAVTESGQLAVDACATLRGVGPGSYFLHYFAGRTLCVLAIEIAGSRCLEMTPDDGSRCIM